MLQRRPHGRVVGHRTRDPQIACGSSPVLTTSSRVQLLLCLSRVGWSGSNQLRVLTMLYSFTFPLAMKSPSRNGQLVFLMELNISF